MPSKYKDIVDCYSKGSRVRLHKMLGLCTSLHDFVYGIEISPEEMEVMRDAAREAGVINEAD